ncbi:hypothetical protein JW935_02955 [candidate division KSB1 bacterium]|nr:hypothetical protein [candidate division KSB1 bacterium]
MKLRFWVLFIICVVISSASARDSVKEGKKSLAKTNLATVDLKTHNVGNMWLSVTNYGQFGSADAGDYSSCEFPANSDVEYLFYGGCWIGAIVDGDTMVSVATDGAVNGPGSTRDAFFPGWAVEDTIIHKSIRRGTSAFDSTAHSEQDYTAVYTDTSKIMGFEGFKPMGIRITQKSYAWSYSYSEDFIIFDFLIENKSSWVFKEPQTFEKLFMAIYIDGDCGHTSTANYAYDDLTGFMQVNSEGDTVNIAWIKDNDGDNGTCSGVTGTRVLFPDPKTVSYNWWDPWRDWAPKDPTVPFDFGFRPDTPPQQYRVMSNGAIDMDQSEATMAPDPNTPIGADSRYLLSFGPFTLRPDSTLKLTLAYVGGLPGPGFDEFEDLGRNARWAKDVYDNPPADGIPDFSGPPPPPAPDLIVTPGDKRVALRWNNFPEYSVDTFSKIVDFQGYRIYRSRTGQLNDMQLLGEFDKIDGYGYDFGFEDAHPEYEIDNTKNPPDTTVWYNFVDTGLTNGEFFYYAVTAYDSGYAPTGLEPLECSALINMTKVAPSKGPGPNDALDVLVVPNPYRIDGNYYDALWESGQSDVDKRIDFTNLPTKCTIRIYTLAGDLVAILDHDYPAKSAIANRESWNLISRNIQAIASGIYLFAVESEQGSYVGKFVVIQ